MPSEHISQRVSDGVQSLRLDRPDKKNALTSEMYRALAEALRDGDDDPRVSAHLFLGRPGIFSAGNDIAEFLEMAEGGALDPHVIGFMKAIATAAKPLVAAVDGLAVGIGTTMLLHCDLVYASPEADFRTPFLNLGLLPEAGSSMLAPALMGHFRAFELLCLGQPFDAERAREAGLVNRIVPAADLEARAREAAQQLAAKPPQALEIARRLLRGDRADIVARIDEEVELFKTRLRSPEAKEAFAAFMEKRTPDFESLRAQAAGE